MSSSASGSESSDRPCPAEPDSTSQPLSGQTSAGERAFAPALLDQVLRQTLAVFGEEGPMDLVEREALLQVFRRHRGDAAAFEAVVLELVRAILGSVFPRISRGSALFEETSAGVAQTLLADPLARKRLLALRRRCDEVP